MREDERPDAKDTHPGRTEGRTMRAEYRVDTVSPSVEHQRIASRSGWQTPRAIVVAFFRAAEHINWASSSSQSDRPKQGQPSGSVGAARDSRLAPAIAFFSFGTNRMPSYLGGHPHFGRTPSDRSQRGCGRARAATCPDNKKRPYHYGFSLTATRKQLESGLGARNKEGAVSTAVRLNGWHVAAPRSDKSK